MQAPVVRLGGDRLCGVVGRWWRAKECIALVEQAVAARGIRPGMLTLDTDNGSAFTARAFKLALGAHGVAHRRDGYRDPESQAFIESCG